VRALVTGHRGFVGRHLTTALIERGWIVRGIDLLDGEDALDFFRTDSTYFDLAVHCAATIGGRAAIDGSPLALGTNLALDSWYMHWLAKTGTPRAVYFSSSAAYPVDLQQPGEITKLHESDIDPTAPEQPDATYGLAKVVGEKLAGYAAELGCQIAIPRPFSGYGEDQALDYPFPSFIARARRRDDPFEIWGDGSSTRDWVHVSDIVGATLAAVDQGITGPFNIGWGRATSFDDLARIVTKRAGYSPLLKHLGGQPTGVHHRVSDPGRMLGFYQPAVTLEEGVRRALAA
jgi:nucleoside-diphosphate-sugar epimerase